MKRGTLEYYERLLAAIFEFMLASGVQRTEALETATRALEQAAKSGALLAARRGSGLAVAALVLDRWHRTRGYIDNEANPRAIPLTGAAPSVEALVRKEGFTQSTATFLRQLRALRLVRPTRGGLYKPSSQIAIIPALDPLVQQHVARSLCMLLRTVKHNVVCRGASSRLIERFAEVPDLPVDQVQNFKKFTEDQGWLLLRTVNDWLEGRRAGRLSRHRRPVARAGLHVYAYVEESQVRRERPPRKAVLGGRPLKPRATRP